MKRALKKVSRTGKTAFRTKPRTGSFLYTQSPNRFSEVRRKAGLSIGEVADLAGCNRRTVYRWDKGEIIPRKPVFDLLEKNAVFALKDSADDPLFTFIDLFAGIGGMRMGFEAVGGKCVFTSEWNKYAQETYQKNFLPDHRIAGDITKIEAEDIPDHDVLLAGFPCQPFSIAGVSKKNALGRPHGFLCEAQGTLFFDVARIIAHCRPKAFLLENVKNLASHDRGNTFRVIMKTLREELGYSVDFRIIDAKAFVPQHRERIFIAGFRKDTGFRFKDLCLTSPGEGPRLNSILHPEDGMEQEEPPYTLGPKAKVADRYTLTPKLWNYLQRYAAKHKAAGNGFGFGLVGGGDTARTLSARYYKDGSEILVKQKGKRPRRLTPRECARLMGFDQPGRDRFRIPVSDTQAYKQFGNAVVVPVVEVVAKHMLSHILRLTHYAYVTQPEQETMVAAY